MPKEVSLIIPNYKTFELTKLCLEYLEKNTDLDRVEVIVVDNNSADESLEYLKTVPYIHLLERDPKDEHGPRMHIEALKLALEHVTSPLVQVMHTDTIMIHPGWLDFLLEKINADPEIAAVGSWKLEYVPLLKRYYQRLETAIRRKLGRKVVDREHYFRSHCALYKTDLVRQAGGFEDDVSAGYCIFAKLRSQGYKLPFIESAELCKYLMHLNHATGLLHAPLSERKGKRRKLFAQLKSLKG
ncbi:MAG: glycosyltransferase [Lentisphaeria bacterium]|nr:glycosyltransferase [Lentisphaeria bacterium]